MDKEQVISVETLRFLRSLCGFVKLNVGDESFRSDAIAMLKALDELDAALAQGSTTPTP